MIGNKDHATAQLPPSRARTARIEECGGHVLHAAGGTIYERVVTVDGSLDLVEVTRHQTKPNRKPDGNWAFYARHTLTWRACSPGCECTVEVRLTESGSMRLDDVELHPRRANAVNTH